MQKQERVFVEIQTGSAEDTLKRLALAAGETILFDLREVKGVETNRISGLHTSSEALVLLLQGTSLSSGVTAEGFLMVAPHKKEGNVSMKGQRRRAALISGTALASLAVVSAGAQDAPPQDGSQDEIVVTGIRQSLQSANERKRNAPNFTDGIAAEDLGKFPDQNVAESLQRISGVTIDRVAGEGSQITIRGFGPEFNIVRLNGRTVATVTDERNFDFQVLPSELIVGADVAKSPTADMWSGSIGGTVDLRTARPLDSSGLTIVGSAQARYQDLSGDWGPRLSGVVSQTFADDTIGVLIAAAYEDREIRTDESRNGEGNANGWLLFDGPVNGAGSPSQQFRVPARSGQSFTTDDRQRTGIQSTVQWRPSSNFEASIDVLYVDFDRTSELQGVIAPLQFNTFDPESLVINENGSAVSFTKLFGPLDLRYETENQASETFALGGNVRYDMNDRVSLSADISWSKAEATNENLLIAPGVRDNNPRNNPLPGGASDPAFAENVITWANGDVPTWSNSFDLTDPGIIRSHIARSLANELEDEVFEARFDADIALNAGIVKNLSVGGFYSDREKSDLPFNNGVGPGGQDSPLGGNIPGWILPGAPLDGFGRPNLAGRFFQAPSEFFTPVTVGDLLSEEDATFPNQFFLIDVNGYCGWLRDVSGNGQICTLNARPDFATGVEETISGMYARLDFEGETLSFPWSANFGLRYQRTETTSSGPFSELLDVVAQDPDGSTSGLLVDTSPSEVIEADHDYSNWLPSFNLSVELTPQTVFRLAAAQVITRPTLDQIIPGQTFPSRSFESFQRIANNPTLDPYKALQLDLSLEYYAENGNAFSLTLFYKDIDTFISEQTQLIDSGFDHPTFGDILTRDLAPRNRQGGTIQGYEVAGLVNFDFLPGAFANLGLQANYTFVSSEDDQANNEIGDLPLAQLPDSGLEGFTPHSYNLVGFYEDERFRARLAYNWRDTFLELRSGPEGIPSHFDAYGQLDAGFAYKINENMELTFEGSNLTDNNTIRFADIRERVLLNEYTGRRYFFGVRGSY